MTIWTASSGNFPSFVDILVALQRIEAKVDALAAKPEPVYPTWGSR
jgi:hypothetical protein